MQNVSILSGNQEEKEALPLPEAQMVIGKVPSIEEYDWIKSDEAAN